MLPAFRHAWPVKLERAPVACPWYEMTISPTMDQTLRLLCYQWDTNGIRFLPGRGEAWTGERIMMKMCMPRGGRFESDLREA